MDISYNDILSNRMLAFSTKFQIDHEKDLGDLQHELGYIVNPPLQNFCDFKFEENESMSLLEALSLYVNGVQEKISTLLTGTLPERCDFCFIEDLQNHKPEAHKVYLMLEDNKLKYRTHLTPGNEPMEFAGGGSRAAALVQAITDKKLEALDQATRAWFMQQIATHYKREHLYGSSLEDMRDAAPTLNEHSFPPEEYTIPASTFQNLTGFSPEKPAEIFSHIIRENRPFLDAVPDTAAARPLKIAAYRRLCAAIANNPSCPQNLKDIILESQPLNNVVQRLAKKNQNTTLLAAVKIAVAYQESIAKKSAPSAANPSTYEAELGNALENRQALPLYFNDVRIQDYLLGQIADLEERGTIGGAKSMRTILTSQLPLVEKLKLLGALGEGKSNNSSFSLSRMGRRSEVAQFYKNLQVFSTLKSNEDIATTFNAAFIGNPKIDAEIQQYFLTLQDLSGIKEAAVLGNPSTPLTQEATWWLIKRKMEISGNIFQNPKKLLDNITNSALELKKYKTILRKAIVSPTTETSLEDVNNFQLATKSNSSISFPNNFKQWMQWAIKNGTPPDLEKLKLIGAIPTTEELKECLTALDKAGLKFSNISAPFIQALALLACETEDTSHDVAMAVIAAAHSGSTNAQAVLQKMFYYMANNKEKLTHLAEKLPAQSSWQLWDAQQENERAMEACLIEQVNSLRPIIRGTSILGGVSLPSALGYNKKISGAKAMTSILKSTLPFEQKIACLAAIGKAKSEQKSGSPTRSQETRNFYALMNHDNINVIITAILYQINDRKTSLPFDEAKFALQYFLESTHEFSVETQQAILDQLKGKTTPEAWDQLTSAMSVHQEVVTCATNQGGDGQNNGRIPVHSSFNPTETVHKIPGLDRIFEILKLTKTTDDHAYCFFKREEFSAGVASIETLENKNITDQAKLAEIVQHLKNAEEVFCKKQHGEKIHAVYCTLKQFITDDLLCKNTVLQTTQLEKLYHALCVVLEHDQPLSNRHPHDDQQASKGSSECTDHT